MASPGPVLPMNGTLMPPYSRHIGGYREVQRIYPQAGGTRPKRKVQTSETLLQLAMIRLMVRRLAKSTA
jgi:hypothetical protein